MPKALIAGATGVVGRNLLRHLLGIGGWEIAALSRRKPDVQGAYEHIAVDLLDAAQCRNKLAHLTDVTHVFYVAVATNPDPLAPALIEANLTMLRNVVETIEPIAPNLQHIHFMQGTKWYGSHLGTFKTPAREHHARHMLRIPTPCSSACGTRCGRRKSFHRWNKTL
jgi:nucleoside-diphosphate-sugar epimerase